jgi:hypothetical protein
MKWQFALCKYDTTFEFVALLIKFCNSNGDIIIYIQIKVLFHFVKYLQLEPTNIMAINLGM